MTPHEGGRVSPAAAVGRGASLVGRPLLPPHPPLLSREQVGERTVWVSPECPKELERPGGVW